MIKIKAGDDVFFLRGLDLIQGAILKIKRGRAKLRYVVASSKEIVTGGVFINPIIINGFDYNVIVECNREDLFKVDIAKIIKEGTEEFIKIMLYGENNDPTQAR